MSDLMSPLTSCMEEVIRPLDDGEERRAVEAVMAHLDLERPVLHGAELRIDKRRGGIPDRQVAVIVADLATYAVYEAIVDSDGAVVQAEPSELVPPFAPTEVDEATVLARAHAEVAGLARRWGVQPAIFCPHQHVGEGDHARHRLVGVHFLDAHDPADVVPITTVVVDLTDGRVDSVGHHQPTTGDGNERGDEGHGAVR